MNRPRDTEEGRAAIESIREQIRRGNRLDFDVGRAKQELAAAEGDKEHPPSPSELERLRMEVRRQSALQLNEYSKAIAMTVSVYGLEPSRRRATSVHPLTRGRTVEWTPIARTPAQRSIEAADGTFNRTRRPRTFLSAAAYADGVVAIDPAAVRKGVEFLASTIYHERIHFEQFTTPGREGLSRQESEKEAYQAEADHAEDFFDPATEEGREGIRDIRKNLSEAEADLQAYRNRRNGPLGTIRRLFPSQDMSEVFEKTLHTEEELARIQAEAERLRDQVAAEFAARRLPPIAPAGPTAPRASSVPYYPTAPLAAPRAYEPVLAPSRAADDQMTTLAEAACRGDWSSARGYLNTFGALESHHLDAMSRRAANSAFCIGGVLRRLVDLRRVESTLTLERLQAETSAVTTPPPDDTFIERETRSGRRPCVQRGVWFKDCY